MSDTKGYIYILTNPSFPQYVKIGYADDDEKAGYNSSDKTAFIQWLDMEK